MTDTTNTPEPVRLLACGYCYEEHGEEVHPHPECPIGKTGTPARYRLRSDEEIEAVQWTGRNADQLRAFCGPDFDTIDPEDRAEDPDQDAQLLSDASHWVGMKPGDWVLKHVDHFTATSDEAFRAVWETAVLPAVPVPPTTHAGDRAAPVDWIDGHPQLEAIAAAVWEQCRHTEHGGCIDDDPRNIAVAAYAAVLPVLTGLASEIRARAFKAAANYVRGHSADERYGRASISTAMCMVSAELRRMADEAQQQPDTETRGTEAHPPGHRWYVETLDELAEEWAPGMRFTDRAEALARFETVSRNHPTWKDGAPVRRRFVRETTSYTVEQPASGPGRVADEEA
ncbi:hypothetical protein AB5J55_35175 [Streptomyces sp. R11]|uniref:Uncharacterized protein n=1 Tax=Streptomyces sp. R11 TaxID=3238625 RepID=A0AB39N7V3_9ACTN